MTPDQYLDAIAAESAHFASATVGSLATSIDFLGGWTVRELVAHLGAVYAFAGANAASGSLEQARPGDEAIAPDESISDWFAERRTTLLATLSSITPDAPAWTFAGVANAGWWMRRMAHETAVHRWDAEAAIDGIDKATPIDGDLAADGIDEYLSVSLRFSSSRPNRVYPSRSLHLHRSDGPGEWMLVADQDNELQVTHEHGKGDAAVRGPASDLLLWVWGRPGTVEIFGDTDVAQAWQDLAP